MRQQSTTTVRSERSGTNLFYAYRFLEGFVLVYPVYMILFRGRGYSFTEISLLIALWAAPVLLLEIPSGILADRWSRKGTVSVGMAFKAAGFLLWWTTGGFPGAALGFVCWGIQEAFSSGAHQAFLYDHLRFHGTERGYDRAAGRGAFFLFSGIALSTLLGGFVFSMSRSVTLLLSSASCLAAAFVSAFWREPPPSERTCGQTGGVARHFVGGLRECLGNRRILSLVIVGCLAGTAYGLIDEYDALWGMARVGVPVLFVGVWMSVRLAFEALGGRLAASLNRTMKLERTGRFRMYIATAGTALLAAAVLPVRIGIPFYFFFFFLISAGTVLMEQRLQDAIDKAGRATVLSISSMIATGAAMLISPVLGILADAFGLPAVLAASGLLTTLAAAVLRAPPMTTARDPD